MTRRPSPARRLWRDRRGVAAVEFALLAPLMVTLFLGVVEASNLVAASGRVNWAAASIADLLGQTGRDETVTATDLQGYARAVQEILRPLPIDGRVTVVVASVILNASNQPVDDPRWGAPKAILGNLLDADPVDYQGGKVLATQTDAVIYVQVKYRYDSMLGLYDGLPLTRESLMVPRLLPGITYAAS